ncbi:RNA-binding protein Nova-1 isoform X2 [Drosophila novamexicana]|uniref:RNA-binding protein Nova-1 isoform X2 n=1 Tax=Drosophila novamexicana TaxID=47314 RepID=UPI0011E60565|nr:RNA-binding protein Nova-1 isoform X2 [Drosophila novamexicana]
MESIMKVFMESAAQQMDTDLYATPQHQEHQQQQQQQQQQQEQQLHQQLQHYAYQYQHSTPTHMTQFNYNNQHQPRHSKTIKAATSPSSLRSLTSGSSSSSSSYSNGSASSINHNAAYSLAVLSYKQQQQQLQQLQQKSAQNYPNLSNTQHHYNQMEPQQQQQPHNHNGSSNVTPDLSTSPISTGSAVQQQHIHLQQISSHETTGNTAAAATAIATTSATATAAASPSYKTASCWCYGDTTFHMKILVPAVASGAIIGKGGETIASLQKDTGARVKMSKSHDFYPGTTERVCLITGSVEGIMTVVDFIMDKIREKPDLTTKIIDAESKQAQERDKQVKILVPNSTAGMIIGKGGAFIKQIKEESGSYVQISQKPKDVSLQERCITIIGDKENNKNACKMILSKIVEDPQSGTCLNVSYADVNGPVANFNPTGSPYATNQNAINSSTASLNSTIGTAIGGAGTATSLLVNGAGINLSLNLGAPNPAPNLAVATQLLEHIKVAMRGAGYAETATTDVCAALGVLAKYGVLGMGLGVPHANGAHPTLGNYLGVTTLDQQTAAAATAATASNVFGAVGQVNFEYAAAAAAAAAASRPTQSQLEVQFDSFRHMGSATAPAATPVSLNNNSFGLTAATGTVTSAQLGAAASIGGLSKSPTPGDLGAKDTKNVEVPEVIIGAVLGPNGRSLVEIQHVSGANVQISKKGIFAPGTRNRIVTITGQPSAIAKAQYLIEQKINEEETKRARQIPLTTVVN